MARYIIEFPSELTEKEKKMIYGFKGELIPCSECKHNKENLCDWHNGIGYKWIVSGEDYCSVGGRIEDNSEDDYDKTRLA